MVCGASRWPEAVALKAADTQNILKAFYEHWITKYGVPKEVISDNASVFDGKEADKFWTKHGINKITTSPHHQASNGLSERHTATLMEALRNLSSNQPKEWNLHLSTALASMRNRVCSATKLSPYQYVFGMNMPSHAPIPNQQDERVEIAARLIKQLNTDEATDNTKARFKIGQQVLIKNEKPKHKFSKKWIGPYTIEREISKHLFELRNSDNIIRRHTDLIKDYRPTDGSSSKDVAAEEKEAEYEIEKIVDSKEIKGTRKYLVQWKGFKKKTWEPLENFSKLYLIRKFHKDNKIPL